MHDKDEEKVRDWMRLIETPKIEGSKEESLNRSLEVLRHSRKSRRKSTIIKRSLEVAVVCLLIVFFATLSPMFHTEDRNNASQFPYELLLSETEGQYTLLTVTDDIQSYKPPQWKSDNIILAPTLSQMYTDELSNVKKELPELDVQSAPYYILFGTQGIALRTDDDQKIYQFLQEKAFAKQLAMEVSKEENQLSIVVLAQNDDQQNLWSNKVMEKVHDTSRTFHFDILNQLTAITPDDGDFAAFFPAEEYPTIFVFDTEKLVLKTSEMDKLQQFLSNFAADVNAETTQGNGGIVAGGVEASLVHQQVSGGIMFTFTIKNQSEQPMTFSFGNSQHFDYIIKDEEGKEIRRFSKGRAFAEVLNHFTLKQAEEKSFDAVVKGLEPGTYTITFWLTADEKQPSVTQQFTVN